MTRRPEDETPTEQLARWRSWREDTAEFPAVQDEILEQPRRPRRRVGTGIVAGVAILAVAMILSGLAAVGIGPVRELLGSDNGGSTDPAPSTSVVTPSTSSSSSVPSGSSVPSDQPSDQPTDQPTDQPSDQPSDQPTDEPSTDAPAGPQPPGRGGNGRGGNGPGGGGPGAGGPGGGGAGDGGGAGGGPAGP